MKKFFIIIAGFFLIFLPGICWSQSWYAQNLELKVIFPSNVWTCIEKAKNYQATGNKDLADKFLRKAEELTLAAEPFNPNNWPSHWPKTQECIDIIRYAPPSAYVYRILGDYAAECLRPKEAIRYIKMYLNRCYIPDARYLYKLGNILESEGLYVQAMDTYQELLQCINSRNFHNNPPSLTALQHRIRNLNAKIEPQVMLILDMKIQELPGFLQDVAGIFKENVSLLGKRYLVIKDEMLDKMLEDQKLTRKDIIDDFEERARIIKLLNVKYVLEPSIVKIENVYIFQVRVYKGDQREPVEIYEYKNENYQFLPNYFQRFFLEFQDKQIPDELLIPENQYKWTFETSDQVIDIAVSENGNTVIAGCQDGRVYIFNRQGKLRKTFKESDEIAYVAISPDGNFTSWASLNGRICFAEGSRIIFQSHVNNLVRAISIAENGKFWVYASNEKIFFLDKNGEIFWNRSASDWIQSIKISHDGNWIAAGTITGEIILYNGEGNCVWRKKLDSRVENIRFSPKLEDISVCTKNDIVYVFSIEGGDVFKFTLGNDVRFLSFNQEIIDCLGGIWNWWYYFPDTKREKMWYYSVDKSVRVADSAVVNNFYVLGKGKNILVYTVVWN